MPESMALRPASHVRLISPLHFAPDKKTVHISSFAKHTRQRRSHGSSCTISHLHACRTGSIRHTREDLRRKGGDEVTDVQQLWDRCTGVIQSQVSDATWRTWFAGIGTVGIVNGTLVLAVPNALVRDRLESRFAGLLHDAIRDTSGSELTIRFDVSATIAES